MLLVTHLADDVDGGGVRSRIVYKFYTERASRYNLCLSYMKEAANYFPAFSSFLLIL